MKFNSLLVMAAIGCAGLSISALPPASLAQGAPVTELTVVPDWRGIPVAKHVVREPALSPDGKTIAFVYDGDIWSVPSTGGVARRLTVTLGNDGAPCFSPDGKWLAFHSRRYGGTSVFVMPAEGGPARRLTHHSASDLPRCWLPDSSGIIFQSARMDLASDLWVVRLAGGEPWPITANGHREHEFHPDISPDGKHIVYVRRGSPSGHQRRGYNGSNNCDIWIADFDGVVTSNHRPLTDGRANETFPCFVSNDTIMYVSYAGIDDSSERVGRFELLGTDGSRPATRPNLRVPNVPDPTESGIGGGKMVVNTGAYGGWNLHVADLATGAVSKIDVQINTDVREASLQVSTASTTSDYAASPDGKLVAFVANDDVHVMGADETSVSIPVTDTIGREGDVCFAWDSRKVVYAAKRGNQPQIYMTDLISKVETQLTDDPMGASRPQMLPGGKAILYCAGERELRTISLPTKEGEAPQPGSIAIAGDFLGANRSNGALASISPDGQWVAYTTTTALGNPQVFVASLKTGESQRVSFQFGRAFSPTFGLCGKRLIWGCTEGADPALYLLELEPPKVSFDEDKLDELLKPAARPSKPAAAEPAKEEPAKGEDQPEKPEADKPEAEKPEARPTPRPAARPKGPPTTNIVWDGLQDRLRRITTMSGVEAEPLGLDDGKTVLFTSGGNIWSVSVELDKPLAPKQITQGTSRKSNLSLSPDAKTLWYLDAGVVSKTRPTGGAATSHRFSVRQLRDKRELRAEAFRECVWLMANYFYDPGMHGVAWEQIAERYIEAMDAVGTNDEWGGMMNQLLGELNSSHQGFTARDSRSDGFSESVATLALVFDPRELAAGRYKIVEALKGGPCDPARADIKVGEYLVGLNGKMFDQTTNLARELNGMAGRKTVLHLASGQERDATTREVAVKPSSTGIEGRLWYDRWIEAQRKMVHELSGGRLGYVHIESMNDASVEHFKHHLGNDLEGKEGAVIDVRYNGGGSTAVDLLEILIKREWLKRTRRGNDGSLSENVYRSIAWEKPATLLTNYASFSNAEIMSEGFQRLNIGKVVGTETGGGVIGTSSATLIDGSRIRMPMSGAYTVEMENLENIGRKPNVDVDNTPADLMAGRDRQTELAVRLLLEECDAAKARGR